MAEFSISNVRIAGMAASLPANKESNDEYDRISEKDRTILIKTTGINERRIAPPGICASDLCFEAAEKLLKDLKWDRSEIKALVLVTQTPDHQMPGSATMLQERLGLPNSCLAFDINQGCAGYVYGLATLSGLMAAAKLDKAILLVGDTITRTVSVEDKSAAPIFSDAGSATALELNEKAVPMHFNLQTDGSGYKAIYTPEGGARKPVTAERLEVHEIAPGISRAGNHLAMSGVDVFNFGLKSVAPNIQELLEYAGKESNNIDYFVFHQANLLLNESIRKKLKIDKEKVPYTLHKYGNTSCGTIPVTIVSELRNQISNGKFNLVLSGFGVGLSWGSAIIEFDEIICPELIEVVE